MRIRSSISTSGGLDTQPLVKQINAWLDVPYKDETTTDENGKEKERINMLEVNTTPGMTATSFIPQQVRAAGMDMKDVLTDIIENKLS